MNLGENGFNYEVEVEGISWIGTMKSDFMYDEYYIKISFELESEETVFSSIELNFNDNDPIYQTECYIDSTNGYPHESFYQSGLFFVNSDLMKDSPCNIISEDFEYIVPITGGLSEFNIQIRNTIIDPNISEEVR